MSIDQPRTPAGSPTGGQYAGIERPESDVDLAPSRAPVSFAPSHQQIPITGSLDIDRIGDPDVDAPWPERIERPEVSFHFDDGVRTVFQFADGGHVECWTGHDGVYDSTDADEPRPAVFAQPGDEEDPDGDEAWYQAQDWMQHVHRSVDSSVYGAGMWAATQPGVHDAVLVAATGRLQGDAPPSRVDALREQLGSLTTAERAELGVDRPNESAVIAEAKILDLRRREAKVTFARGDRLVEGVVRHGAWTTEGQLASSSTDFRDSCVRVTTSSGFETFVPFIELREAAEFGALCER